MTILRSPHSGDTYILENEFTQKSSPFSVLRNVLFVPSSLANDKVLMICHRDWLGIKAATLELRLPTLLVDDSMLGDAETKENIVSFLLDRGTRLVAIHGVPPGGIEFASFLKQQIPSITIVFTWHGSFTQHHTQKSESKTLHALLTASSAGVVSRIGFLKEGMARFHTTMGYNADIVGNLQRPYALKFGKASVIDGRMHFGVFGRPDSWIKNTINQVAAVCMFENSVLHVLDITEQAEVFFSRNCHAVVVKHGPIPQAMMPFFLGMMDINLYVSLTECFPMTVLQSVAAGTPCLTSMTSGVYDSDPTLKEILSVTRTDDAYGIFLKAAELRDNLDTVKPRLANFLKTSNDHWARQWSRFLDTSITEVFSPDIITEISAADSTAVLHAHSSPQEKFKICFVTNELGRVTPGGAGVLMDGVVREISAVIDVIVIADVSRGIADKWLALLRTENIVISFYLMDDLVPRASKLTCLSKSVRVASALKIVYQKERFHMVEGFDFFGMLYETLRGGYRYLPEHVTKAVRLHGTIQLIETAESVFVGGNVERSEDYYACNVMEQYAMTAADVLISNGRNISLLYLDFYPSLMSRQFVEIIPPVSKIMASVSNSLVIDRSSSNRILVYGKQSLVKGSTLILDAAVRWLRESKEDAYFYFIGSNLMPNCADRICLLERIPDNLKSRFYFQNFIGKDELSTIAPTFRLGIFASIFETFCLAAHEVYALGVPLLVSDIAATRNFFVEPNVIFFNKFSVQAIFDAINVNYFSLHFLTGTRRSLDYANSSFPYLELLHNPKLKLKQPTILKELEQTIARLVDVTQYV